MSLSEITTDVLILGLGNLGRRHLQGILSSKVHARIYCVEPNMENIKLTQTMLEQLPNANAKSSIKFSQRIPQGINFFLFISACTADQRYSTTVEVLRRNTVKYIILEKVLFSELADYQRFSSNIDNEIVYVNCARRENVKYHQIKSNLNVEHGIAITIHGGGWGLCCNGIHFIDLFWFMTDGKKFEKTSLLQEGKLFESKRPGFWECNGRYTIVSGGNDFSMTCDESTDDITITIENLEKRFFINESKGIIKEFINNDLITETKLSFEMQSHLTGKYLDKLYDGVELNLPRYNASSYLHEIFLKDLHNCFFEHYGVSTKSHPIT